ncbi:pyridoxamine 5'-phosphate oxidase family protein [Pseudonocardia sp. TRM90224]|uniref:pyridoxamine 5'-phosphate oxidase family protein n=1 Tax=Pseudonocardia sp. TRM90224 TaxID=2812678 RepID=UPI001E2A9D35|nr:pyridoxamine 5'-phosphate oxidase family protein [Pseudonocardia sp. TRM90224]
MVAGFVALAHEIVWCTLVTIDTAGRPRSRVVHPVWEVTGDGELFGWLTTRSGTPKLRHIAATPHVSCSYWRENHDTAVAECHTDVVDDEIERKRVWELLAGTPAPAGFDPATIWPGGPQDPGLTLVRMRPWLLRFARASVLAAGGQPEIHRIGSSTALPAGDHH